MLLHQVILFLIILQSLCDINWDSAIKATNKIVKVTHNVGENIHVSTLGPSHNYLIVGVTFQHEQSIATHARRSAFQNTKTTCITSRCVPVLIPMFRNNIIAEDKTITLSVSDNQRPTDTLCVERGLRTSLGEFACYMSLLFQFYLL